METSYIADSDLKQAYLDSIDPRVLSITIFITEQCNFRCTYCYETFERKAMSQDILRSILKLINKRASSLEHLSISWFGGEPLLGSSTILNFSDSIQELSQTHGFSREDSISTNGYLLNRGLAEDLIKSKVKVFQITLDGSQEHHDRSRLQRNGNGSYDAIMSNLRSLRDIQEDFRVAIRLHVNHQNAESIPEFVSYLDSEFGDDTRFGLSIFPVERFATGDSVNYQDEPTPNEFHRAFNKCIDSAKTIRILNNTNGKCYVCYAAKANSLVFRSDGVLMKCTVSVDDPANHVGHILSDGTLSINQDRFRWWIRGFVDYNKALLSCPKVEYPQR
jgi:uncharacterized protein